MRYKFFLILALLLAVYGVAHAKDDSNTAHQIPTGNAAMLPNLQTFLGTESASRALEDGLVNFVDNASNDSIAGACLGTTGAGLTMTPGACIAYNAGLRSTCGVGNNLGLGPTGVVPTSATSDCPGGNSITFPDNSTCWVAMDENTVGNNAGIPTFTRVTGTHYLTDCSSALTPTMVYDTQLLMLVTTSGGSIITVNDLRNFSPFTPPINGADVFVHSITGIGVQPFIKGFSVNGVQNVVAYGVLSGASALTSNFSADINSGSGAVVVHSAGTLPAGWVNGMGVVIIGAGAATSLTTPSAPAVTGLPSWASGAVVPVGYQIVDSNNNIEMVTTAGTTGVSAPTWVSASGCPTPSPVPTGTPSPTPTTSPTPTSTPTLAPTPTATPTPTPTSSPTPTATPTPGLCVTIDNTVTWQNLGPATTYYYKSQLIDDKGGRTALSPASTVVYNAATLEGVNYGNTVVVDVTTSTRAVVIYRSTDNSTFNPTNIEPATVNVKAPDTSGMYFYDYGHATVSYTNLSTAAQPQNLAGTVCSATTIGFTLCGGVLAGTTVSGANAYHDDAGIINLAIASGGPVYLQPNPDTNANYAISQEIVCGAAGGACNNLVIQGEGRRNPTLQSTDALVGLPMLMLENAAFPKVAHVLFVGDVAAPPLAGILSDRNNPVGLVAGVGNGLFDDFDVLGATGHVLNNVVFSAAPGWDDNNDSQTLSNCDLRGAVDAGVYFGHLNPLQTTIKCNNLTTGQYSIKMNGGSFSMVGGFVGAASAATGGFAVFVGPYADVRGGVFTGVSSDNTVTSGVIRTDPTSRNNDGSGEPNNFQIIGGHWLNGAANSYEFDLESPDTGITATNVVGFGIGKVGMKSRFYAPAKFVTNMMCLSPVVTLTAPLTLINNQYSSGSCIGTVNEIGAGSIIAINDPIKTGGTNTVTTDLLNFCQQNTTPDGSALPQFTVGSQQCFVWTQTAGASQTLGPCGLSGYGNWSGYLMINESVQDHCTFWLNASTGVVTKDKDPSSKCGTSASASDFNVYSNGTCFVIQNNHGANQQMIASFYQGF